MSRFTLDDYYGQRRTLTIAISEQEAKRTELEGKIRRLEKASNSLQNYIEVIEDSHKKITDLTIDEGRWHGTEKNKFDNSHQSLKSGTKNFLSQTEDARTRVEEELSRCQANLESVESTISHFRSSLANVNSQIEARRNSE